MEDDSISELELSKYFLTYYRKTLEQIDRHPNFKLGQNNYHLLTTEQKEVLKLMTYKNKIYDLLADIEKTHTFIKRFPAKAFYEKNDIDQLDYIKYHYEVFIHKIHTLLEVKKLWLNDFYQIGLKEKDCNWDNLKKHPKIEKSITKPIIDNYYKTFKHLITYRHLNTHRAFYQDEKSDFLKTDLLIYSGYKKFGVDAGNDYRRIRPKVLVDYEIKAYRKEKLNYIKEGIEAARYYSEKFIAALLHEFFHQIIKKDNSLF